MKKIVQHNLYRYKFYVQFLPSKQTCHERGFTMHSMHQIAFSAVLFTSLTSPSFAFFDELVKGLTSVTNNLIDSTESVTNNTVNTASTTMVSLSGNPGKMADRIGVMADRIGFMADRIVTTEGIMAGLAHKIIDRTMEPRVAPQYAPQYAAHAHTAPMPMPTYYRVNDYGNTYGGAYPQPARPALAQQVNTNPYLATQAVPQMPAHSHGFGTPVYGNPVRHTSAQPDNSRYSASYIIFGNTGSTYTAAYTAAQAGRMPTSVPSSVPSSAPSNHYGFPTMAPAAAAAPAAAPTAVTKTANSCGYSFGLPRRSC
jgi:hypothetical protein